MARILDIGSQWVNSSGVLDLIKGDVFQLYLCKNHEKNRIKVLSSRLLQRLVPVHTLTADGCSEAGPAMHSSNHAFWSQ